MIPGIAPAAKQEGQYVAKPIRSRLNNDNAAIKPFRYRHQGNLATIGRGLAVVDMGWFKLRGALAWWFWKIIHLYFLIGTRNRLSVAISWVWNHSVAYRGSPHYHGSQISGPGYAASQFSYRRRIRRVPLKLQRCPTWYHRAQLQQSVSGHTNAFFDGLSDRAVRHTRYRYKRRPY